MSFLRFAIVLAVIAGIAAGRSVAHRFGRVARSPGPNVVLIVMDTTRADRCSFLGYARPTTPRLAELAKSSTVFTDAWAPCCWTGPSHASLFTGLSPRNHGLQDGIRLYLAPEATTLAERFKDAGWRTACFSNNDVVSPQFGLTQGFDLLDAAYRHPSRPYPFATESHEKALEWATSKDADGKPFFLFINDMEPHLAYAPPAEMAAKFVRGEPSADELTEARRFQFPWSVGFNLGVVDVTPKQIALLSDLYDAEIATLDAEIGRLLDGLEAAGMLENTIVVITADHGEYLGEHHRLGHTFGLHRTVLRVPLLVRFRGRFDGGRQVSDLVRLEDVAPTLLELCGVAVPPDLDGKSLTSDLPGRIANAEFGTQQRYIPEIRRTFPHADLSMFSTTIRSWCDGRLHYIRDSTGREELYDVVADPDEAIDLAPGGGPGLERMRKLAAE